MANESMDEGLARWRAGVLEKLTDLKATSCAELLSRFPGVPYAEVIAAIGGDVTPIQLQTTYLREAKRGNFVREAAADTLVRELNEGLPGGWGNGEDPEFRAALSYSTWVASLVASGGMPELQAIARTVWHALRAVPPPKGWRPVGADDAIIRRAFDEAWPSETSGRSDG